MHSSPPPSSPVPLAHLTLAAFFGASLMAISTFYGHNRSVSQVLDHLINKFRRRGHHLPSDDEHYEFSDSDGNSETDRNASKNMLVGYSGDHAKDGESDTRDYRVSSSIANSSDRNNERGGEEAGVAVNSLLSRSFGIIDSISPELPPVRTDQRDGEEQYVNHSGTSMRVGSAGRLVTPRAAGGYAFESTGDSEDEGTELEVDEDILSYQNVGIADIAEM